MGLLRRFMYGRYGSDQLSVFLIAANILLLIAFVIFSQYFLWLLSLIPLLFVLWRMMSKNIKKRESENRAFLRLWNPIKKFLKKTLMRVKDRKHRYFKCSGCHATLRVPKGAGQIVVTCPACSVKTDKKA